MLRIGFVLDAFGGSWLGGSNYLSNLVRVLNTIEGSQFQTLMFSSLPSSEHLLAKFPVTEWVQTNYFKQRSFAKASSRITKAVIGRSILQESLFKKHNVDVAALIPSLGGNSNVPFVGWIPDFQHVHLPSLFSEDEVATRDRVFSQTVRDARLVIVSSKSALDDFRNFAPGMVNKARVLRFVSLPDFSADSTIIDFGGLYGIDEPFLYLPNQFWAHKNHKIVVEALAILRGRGHAPLVVCTGNKADYRAPGYFDELMTNAQRLNVNDRFRVLGVVPYEHVRGLYDRSVAVLNPSLFEGWSTSVEESKSLGKRVILSAIPTHIEQNPVRGLLFDPYDAEALAHCMQKVMSEYSSTNEPQDRLLATKDFSERVRAMALDLQSIFTEIA
ncbi:glycosyltransferase family 1 protein [Microcoleus sp. F10_A2]|jgi:hypothetical protein|uniref:glycosyltransferase family 4 protein n=1 Tax=Microcoleus sp. A6-C5 TaxID=2818547 RepID=UPI002FD602DB